MLAYKGFDEKLRGWGDFQFKPDVWYREKECKTVRNGFHCTEYPLACMQYFTPGDGTRYFEVEIGGEIDEDEWRIAATEVRLIRELNLKEMALLGMQFMIEHEKRGGWEITANNISVNRDFAEAKIIAIARGEDPKVRGITGTICGLIREKDGVITQARMFTIGRELDPGSYELDEDGEIRRCG